MPVALKVHFSRMVAKQWNRMFKISKKTGILSIPVLLILLAFIAKTNNEINPVRFIYSLDSFFGEERRFITVTDSVDIYSYKTYKIYVSSWTHDSLKLEKDTMRTVSSKKMRAFFIAKANEKKGYWFDDLSVKNPSMKDVDSLLTKRFAKTFPYYIDGVQQLLNKTNRDGIDIETYLCKEKKDRSYFDTLTYHFDKRLKHAPHSISPFLDSTHNSKLTKVSFVYNPQPADKQGPATPRRGYRFELKSIKEDEEEKKVIALVERFIASQGIR